ncbi:MAG: hypothetical protein ACFFD1_02895 [Candidatus Thorarchaeota archaeon]
MSPKVLSDKAIPLETVKDLLKNRSQIADLNYIQRITLDFGHRFSIVFPKSEEFLDMISKSYNLSREDIIQLITINPEKNEEVDLILEDKVTSEDKENILKLLSEHREKYVVEEEPLPDDISAASFSDYDDKSDYPDEEPTDTDQE